MGSKAREGAKAMSLAFALCQKKSVVYEMECRHAAVQRGNDDDEVMLNVLRCQLTY